MPKNGGGNMDLLIIFALCCAAAGYAIWKYDKAERTDYKAAVEEFKSLRADVKKYKEESDSWQRTAEAARTRTEQLYAQVESYKKDVDDVQTHCASLREGQIELRDRSFPRKIQVQWKPQGAIPIEIYTPTAPTKPKAPVAQAPKIPDGPPPVPEAKPKRPGKQPLGRGVKSVLGQ
jgi:FtsZ-binding cell division protein ZapB